MKSEVAVLVLANVEHVLQKKNIFSNLFQPNAFALTRKKNEVK